MSRRRQLGPRLANIDRAIAVLEVGRAMRELGTRRVRKYLVVRVAEDETDQQAKTRTLTMNPWYGELSSEARERVQLIMVRRVADGVSA